MANSEALAGAHSYVLWGKETTFNTAVTPSAHFSATLQNFRGTINNNMVANYAFSGATAAEGRQVYNYTPGVLEIGAQASMKVTNWTWFEHVLGTVAGAGPYTYAVAAIPPSMTISTNIDNPGTSATDQKVTYSGCVIESTNIKSSFGQPVFADLDFKIAKAVIATSLDTRVALPSENVYNFAGGSIELPNGSALSNIIDSVELSIKNSWTMMAGIGSILIQNAIAGGLEINVAITLKYLDNALYTAALGATTPTSTGGPTQYATMELNFAEGNRSMAILLTGVPMSEFAQIHELQNPISETLNFTAKYAGGTEDRTA